MTFARLLRRQAGSFSAMLLFYWPSLSCYSGTAPGLAIAYARTLEEAKSAIVRSVPNLISQPGLKALVRAELDQKEPRIYRDRWGMALVGEEWYSSPIGDTGFW